ncbi:hypothetical protein C0993_011526 [Termitomyces sp. T159_Od127]|nr:hypothetical protein C0993_011526 [Termitomyces sp. T159_Od127]
MKSFFQRHSGTRKPTSDSTTTYQVWLPPSIESRDDRTRYRTSGEPLTCTDASRADGKSASNRTRNDSIPHITPSRNDYTTYPSTGRGSHVPTNIPPTATPSYPDPGQYLGGSAGWSTSQRPLVSMWPPSVGHTPTAHREDDAQRRKRSDDRYRDADNGGERERRTLEREADVARYKARVVEKSGRRKDYVQQKHEDEDRRGVLNDEREKKDRRRNREKIRGNREKESESDRNHDREQGRNERTGVHGRAEEYQEAHRLRERGKDRTVDRVQPTEGHTDRDVTRDLRSREREKGNVDRREKARKKDDGFGRSEREHRRNGKEPAKAGRYGVGEISGVHKDLREEHPYMTDQPREREDEFKQGRQHNDVRELDQRECRRDIRKEKNYLNRRFEPGSAEWDSASMRSPQHRKRHRYNSAHDGTDSDSSPRKGLPRPSKDKCNLAKVEADHVSIMERLDSVPSAPPDLALTYSRQAVSPSSSRENQARYANLNYPSLPLGHRETSLTLVSPERLSRVDTTAIATSLGEVGHSKHKEHQTIENNPNPVLSEFPRERLALHDAEPLNSNAGRSKYDEVSDSLSSRWHLSKKRSSPQPSPLMDHNPSVVPAEKQRLAEQLDQIPKKVYTTASRQAALREVEMSSTSKYITRTVENHSKLLSTDAPSVGCSGSQNVTHQGRHLSNPNTNSIPSGFPADTHASVVRESRIESHWHRPEMTTSRTTDPQTPNILKVMQPRLQARDQTSQILFNPGSRASSDTPTVDISRKPLEFIASKDRPLTAQSIRETPNHLYNVDPVHDQTSMQIRTTSYGIQAEQTPEEIAPGKSSQCHDTSPTFLNHMQSTLSTPVVVGITGSIAQTLVTLPSIRQSSAHGPTAVREDVSLQIHPDLGNAIRSSSSQGAHHPSVTSDIVAEHKVTEQFLTYLPNTRPVDDTLKNSKVSSSLDIPTHLIHSHIQTKPMEYPLSQQGQPGSFPSMEITNTLPHRPATRQLSYTEHLPQNICNARTDRTPLDNNASRSQIHISHHLQEASAGSDTKARALPTSIEPSSAVVLNENTGHLQHTDINMADQASTQTRTARVPDQTYPAMTETETKSSRSLSIVQQRKMTDMRAEAVHIEEMPIAPGATNDVDNPTSSPTTFIPSSSDADLNRVSSPSNQLVRSTGFAGSPLEVSANVNEQTSSSCLADPVIAAKDRNLLQSKRPDEFGNVGTSTSRDVIYIDSRYANTKANDIGGVITSSVNSATVNSTSLPSDQITSDGPSRYRSSTESLVQRYSDKGQRFPPELKPSVLKLRTEYKASLIPSQAQSEAATQILRPATAIGYRQISGEGSIPLLTGMRDVPSGNKASISAIQRPATAMSSRHLLSERPRIHSVLQAPNVEAGPLTLLQSRLTGPSNGVIPTHNRAISSTQSINKLVVPLSTKPERASSKHMWNEAQSNSDHRYEEKLRNMQLHGQQLNTNTSGPELEHPVNKNGVPSLGHTHGAPLRPPPGDLPLVQHHVVSNTSFRDDSNVASSSRSQPRESIGRAIAVSKGDQLPIQNARLAELLSNAVPLHEQTPPNALNNLETSRPVITRSGQSSVVRPGVEQPTLQMTQPEPTSLNHKRVPEKHSQDAGSRTSPVLKSARISEQYGPLENLTTPSMGMLASTSQQSVLGDNHTLPPIADTTAQSRINQDHLVGSKSQKHIAPQIGNHGSHSSTIHVQKTQKHPHTHDDPNKGPRRGTVELSPTQPSPVNNTHPAGVTQLTSHHQTSQRATRNKDQSKASQKHNPVFQSSHTASIDTAVVPNSSTSGDFPLKVSATHKSSHQRPQGVLSTRDNDYHRSSHKLAMASSSKHLVPPSNVRPDVSSTQRTELHSHRSRTTTPINNPSSSQVDLMLNRHVLPSSSQVPQPSLQRNVYVPSPSVTSSVKPRSTSRNHGQTAMRSTSTVPPSKTYPNQQGDTAFEAPIHTIQPPALQQSIPTSALLPDPALSRSRRPSEDSVLLRTPSSLTPTILKPSISRTSIPASFSSQTSSKKRGLFSMFRSKLSQSPDQGEESKKQAPRKLRKETKPRAESFSAAAPPPDIKVTSAVSSRAKAPPIAVPIGVQPVTESKSPNKVFTPFRYLTTKRNRRVSQASLEAQDGTAPPPIQAPPLRDVFAATQEWRRMEAAEVREVTGGKLRRARPGVVFDVAEDHTEEDRPKIRPQSRQS